MQLFDKESKLGFIGKDRFILFLACSFLFLAFILDIYGPGYAFEELDEATASIQMLKGLHPTCSFWFRIMGKDLPVIVNNPYMGSVQTYLLTPLFAVFGENFFPIRFLGFLFSIGILFFTYYFLKTWFNKAVALIALLLLLTQPDYVLSTKLGVFFNTILNLFSMAALYYFSKWVNSRKITYLYISCFILGIGLWTKIPVVLLLLGILFGYLLLFIHEIELKRKQSFLAFLFFFLGYLPSFIASLWMGGGTFTRIIQALKGPGDNCSGNNHHFLQNFILRIHQFISLFGKAEFDGFFSLNALSTLNIFAYMFSAAVIYLLAVKKSALNRKRVLFIFILFGTIFTGLCFTLSLFRPGHLIFLFPLPQVILALFLYELFMKSTGILKVIPVFLLLLAIYPNIIILEKCYSKDISVPNCYNPASEDVADYLLTKGINTVYTIDPEFIIGKVIIFLAKSNVSFYPVFNSNNAGMDFFNAVKQNKMGREFFLLTYPDFTDWLSNEANYRKWNDFFISHSGHVEKVKKFTDNRTGETVYLLYKVDLN